ncbi:cation transporter [Fluviibacterium sp. DFM31]|uniref:Cation transporter n=1 Tax=Meridianimarinicoccus marinus TaxID=3231483 RepID=A0ABV3L291_9RHOB
MQADAAAFRLEQRALRVGKWANLGMAIAGVLAAWLSNSQALLVDGLFSMVGFLSAIVAIRISSNTRRGADDNRPMGYAVDESIYQTFRSLLLLGLVMFGITSAAMNIARYAAGAEMPPLNFNVIVVYFVGICATCLALALIHYRAWVRSGRISDILRLEMLAARYDGFITLAAGAGLSLGPYLSTTPLAWMAPIMDSLVVIFLCGISISMYWREFRGGLAELAGVTAAPDVLASAETAIIPALASLGMNIREISLIKQGRRFQMILYVRPARPVTGRRVDAATHAVKKALYPVLGRVDCVLVPTEEGRDLSLAQIRPDPTEAPA